MCMNFAAGHKVASKEDAAVANQRAANAGTSGSDRRQTAALSAIVMHTLFTYIISYTRTGVDPRCSTSTTQIL